jgi:hypothetical protein
LGTKRQQMLKIKWRPEFLCIWHELLPPWLSYSTLTATLVYSYRFPLYGNHENHDPNPHRTENLLSPRLQRRSCLQAPCPHCDSDSTNKPVSRNISQIMKVKGGIPLSVIGAGHALPN